MNPEQVVGLIRQFLPFAGGIAAALGWSAQFDMASNLILQIAGPAATIASVIWSMWSKTHANIVSAAAVVPGVREIVLQPNAAGQALAPATPPNVNIVSAPPIR